MSGNTLLAQKISANDKFGFDHKRMINALRGVAQDNARLKIEAAQFTDVTDSTTGSVGTSITSVAMPVASVGAATTSSPKAGFDTATGKLNDCAAAFADFLNPILAQLGLDQVIQGNGTVNTAGTLDALDKTLTAVDGSSGTNAVDVVTGAAEVTVAKINQALLSERVNAVLIAVGDAAISGAAGAIPIDNASNPSYTLQSRAVTGTGVGGTTKVTMLDTEVDTALTTLANNYATLADVLNRAVLTQAGVADLTDSSGGTSTGDVVADMGTMTPFTTAGTDCTPKAGFDTEIAKWRNNFADLALRTNLLAVRHGVTELTDSSAGTANTTLEAVLAALTAVTGTTVCIDQASALVTWDAVKDNTATLIAKVNELASFYGSDAIVDSSGGTASTSNTVVAMPNTAAGNDGTSSQSVADTEGDADLVLLRNTFATLAAKLAEMTGTYNTQAQTKPLNIVATA